MAADEVKAWANPTDKLLGLSFSAGKYYRLKLVDANGKTLLTKMITNTQNNTKLDLSNYAKGVYIVEFMGLSGNKNIRILK
nr:T9SS type A sorting domain-containing protein [Pedobacter sp. ASV28]